MTAGAPARPADHGFFERRIAPFGFAAALIGLLLYALTTAAAPGGGSGRDGGAHGLSPGATGFNGIIEVGRGAGLDIAVDRSVAARDPRGLTVLTPENVEIYEQGSDRLRERLDRLRGPVLVVLLKHLTVPDQNLGRGFVRSQDGGAPAFALGRLNLSVTPLATDAAATLSLRPIGVGRDLPLPRRLQSATILAGEGKAAARWEALLRYGDAPVLLHGELGGRELYLLTDPDLLSNLTLNDPERVAGGLDLLFALSKGRPVRFDVALNGLASDSRSLLQRALAPPWLGLTLAGLAAMIALLWAGFQRPAPPSVAPAPFAQGKAALIHSGARLVSASGRWRMLIPRYIGWVRDSAARARHAPPGLEGAALDAWLDRFTDRQGQGFAARAAALDAARSPIDMVQRAGELARWKQEMAA